MDFFRPMWRRIAVTAFIAAWFAWEALWNHDQLWMMITGAALAYAVWNLFIKFDANDKGPAAAPQAAPQEPPKAATKEESPKDDAKPEN